MQDPLKPDETLGRALRVAKGLFVTADLLWPLMAYAAASVLAGWLDGVQSFGWIAVFVLAGMLRAMLRSMAARRAFDAGQAIVAAQRRALLLRQSQHLGGPLSSAECAVLLADKLPLLAPYFSRYRIQMSRLRLVPLVFLGLAFWHSWAVGVVLLVAGPLIPVFMALVGMAAKEASARQMVEIGAVNRLLVDRITALPDILFLQGYIRARAQVAQRLEALRESTMAVLRIAFLSSTVLELFAALGVAMVAVYVGFSLLGEIGFGTWGKPLSVTQGVFLLLLAPEFFQPLRDLAASWHDKAEAVRDEVLSFHASPGAAIVGTGAEGETLPVGKILRIENAVARGIALPDFTVKPGQGLALTGPSGVGKTTVLHALAGLIALERGRILLGDQPLDAQTADGWRAGLALVSQRPHVREQTLGDWLGPGDVAAALKDAGAVAIVASLPEGLQTRLGESGAGVSGGEARRLMLARALLRDARVILADEPTADLDAKTAAQVIATLRRLIAEGRMVIVATHDPVLAAAMDRTLEVGT